MHVAPRGRRLAKAVFDHHTAGCSYPAGKSGAEWWVQVRSLDEGKGEAQRGISFHWDMDLEVWRSHGAGLHPHLSTVTNLTDRGGPTMVVEQRRPDEEAGVRLRPREDLLLSFPATGKHLAFDGRFLHGVPCPSPVKSSPSPVKSSPSSSTSAATVAAAAAAPEGLRVTFLVNIWVRARLSNSRNGVTHAPPRPAVSASHAACSLGSPFSFAAVPARLHARVPAEVPGPILCGSDFQVRGRARGQ